jgi:hypothetical protein
MLLCTHTVHMNQAVTKILGEIERLNEQRHNARHVIETNAGELTTVRRQVKLNNSKECYRRIL